LVYGKGGRRKKKGRGGTPWMSFSANRKKKKEKRKKNDGFDLQHRLREGNKREEERGAPHISLRKKKSKPP